MAKPQKQRPYTGKFKGRVPMQVFIVQRYSRPATRWQRILKQANARGVWSITCHVNAYSAQHACSVARFSFPYLRRQGVKLRAIATYEEVE